MVHAGRFSKQNVVVAQSVLDITQIEFELDRVVHILIEPLLVVFNFMQISLEVVREELIRMLRTDEHLSK